MQEPKTPLVILKIVITVIKNVVTAKVSNRERGERAFFPTPKYQVNSKCLHGHYSQVTKLSDTNFLAALVRSRTDFFFLFFFF